MISAVVRFKIPGSEKEVQIMRKSLNKSKKKPMPVKIAPYSITQ